MPPDVTLHNPQKRSSTDVRQIIQARINIRIGSHLYFAYQPVLGRAISVQNDPKGMFFFFFCILCMAFLVGTRLLMNRFPYTVRAAGGLTLA